MFEFDALTKSYGHKLVLDELTFAVAPGELFGFCGANGAGKTTAMRIALGLLRADRGEVRWQGRPVDTDLRRRIGYMPEERGLYGRMRPVEQLAYFARLAGVPKDVAVRRAHAWVERMDVRMAGDDTLEQLSLGNQQKVQLIAALIHEPDILVLDEPFSGLDPVATDDMAAALVEVTGRGVPVLFSSHQLDLVERLCDRVGIITRGALVAQGTVAELRGTGTQVYRVAVDDAPADWVDDLPGTLVHTDSAGAVVDLGSHGSSTQLLDRARSLGRVTHFSRQDPTLAEIFRKAVAA